MAARISPPPNYSLSVSIAICIALHSAGNRFDGERRRANPYSDACRGAPFSRPHRHRRLLGRRADRTPVRSRYPTHHAAALPTPLSFQNLSYSPSNLPKRNHFVHSCARAFRRTCRRSRRAAIASSAGGHRPRALLCRSPSPSSFALGDSNHRSQ